MQKKIKQQIVPVSVSQCVPVYNAGKLKRWEITVECDGDLAVNSHNIESWRGFFAKYPALAENKPDLYDLFCPIFKDNVKIPKFCHWSGDFGYDYERGTSLLKYSWRNGLFGLGAKRAWNFRIKMLARIDKQKAK